MTPNASSASNKKTTFFDSDVTKTTEGRRMSRRILRRGTPPPPNATEMLIAAIKDFFRAIKNFNLTGNFIPPTFVQDIETLASLHNGSAEQSILSTTDATPTASVPAPPMEPRVVQPVISQPSVQEIRVVETPHSIKEPRVVIPTLAITNPVHTACSLGPADHHCAHVDAISSAAGFAPSTQHR